MRDWRSAGLTALDHALCEFAALVTHGDTTAQDLDRLRTVGLDDTGIHDAVQVIAYFNYITRVADTLGVEPETFIEAWGAEADPTPPSSTT